MTNKAYIIIFLTALLPIFGKAQTLSVSLNSVVRPSCFGLSNGSASVSATGGIAPYHFHWSACMLDTNKIDNLAAGHYSITVSDNGGSEPVVLSFNLSSPSQFNGNVSLSGTPTCMGMQTTVSANGGTAPYTGIGSFMAPPGENIVIVSDANGCADTLPVNVPGSNLKMNVTVDSACAGGSVLVMVTATGGIAPYSGTGMISAGAGVHYFRVSDSLGCMVVDTVIIPAFAKTQLTITASQSAAICNTDSIILTATAGYSSYTWNTGVTTTTPTLTTSTAGNYYVVVTDQHNCYTESNHLDVSVHPAAMVSVTVSGDTLKAYNAEAYQWYYENKVITGAQGEMLVATQPGEYAVSIKDANGCSATSNPVTISVTGINEIDQQTFNVYPNPSTGNNTHLNVTSNLIGSHLEVYNTNGQIVYSAEINSLQSEIQLGNIAQGTYVLRITTANNQVITRKLVRL